MTDTIAVIAGEPGQNTYIIDVVLGGLESMLTFGAERLVVVTSNSVVRAVAEARHRCEVYTKAPSRPHIVIVFGAREQRTSDKAARLGIPLYRILQWVGPDERQED